MIPSRDSALSDIAPAFSILENAQFLASLSQIHGNPGSDPTAPPFSKTTMSNGKQSPDLPRKIRVKEVQRQQVDLIES